ncbi:Translocase of outer mitochondrial membrane 22 [Fasciola hepatica]|uniref:Mitochondrial import receptor subunit TOM22 homolog n=1 Tax=Fasciola hepatica TaxID=6192 RepID=A0A2H1BSF2_FASHE|nr:Translocase of outer mitochondrial membrane 22 [Fasciola hepatica]
MSSDAEVVELPPPAYIQSSNGFPIEPDQRTTPTSKNNAVEEVETSERHKFLAETGDDDSDVDDDEFEDETLVERLMGLTEMFPESVRRTFSSAASMTFSGIKSTYSLSRSVSWFLASTATLCFLPLFLELERVQTEEQEAVHQRTMMLGPRAAGGGSGLAGFSSALPHLTPMESK